MKPTIDALKKYLVEVAKLETEQFRIYIENGKATAVFDEIEMLNVQKNQITAIISYTPAPSEMNFLMRNNYVLSVHFSNYGGDINSLLSLLLWFMHDKLQAVELDYVIEDNNNSTCDLWIDVTINEHTRNDGEGVHTC